MKRSRHRWVGFSVFSILLASAVLLSDLPPTSALKATSLIFAKTSSTTAAPQETADTEDGPQTETTAEGAEQNTTRKLSGIPQIDYLQDPNLPRELNGYNLSAYPFYATVPAPELMDFKCDGLHDGFYASVPHKCQVYHHCLYGTRYDFLCANYTAFDQKTFICQFVSEVDCKNSADYFSRNEALYKATTQAPPPSTTTTTTTTTTVRPPRPGRRRPYHRYDYYDDDYYYPARDDYDYEERRPDGRRSRPRAQGRPGKKRRPADDYEDDRYERRPRPRDEEPEDYEDRRYDRRPGKRPAYPDRRPYDEDDRRPGLRNRRPRPRDEEEDEDIPRPQQRDDLRPKRPRDDIKPRDEAKRDEIRPRDEVGRDDEEEEVTPRGQKRDDLRSKRPRDDIKPRDDARREETRPRDESRREDDADEDDVRPPKRDDLRSKRPRDEIKPRDESRRDETRPRNEFRPRDESRARDVIRPRDETRQRDEIKPRDEDIRTRDEIRSRDRRPSRDETTEKPRFQPSEGRRFQDERPREDRPYLKPTNYDSEDRNQDEKREIPSAPDGLVKPNGHGLFSQPRAPPKIKRPVPLSAKQKFEYVTITTTKSPPKVDDDDYYYDEDETSRPSSSGKTSSVQQRPKPEPVEREKFKPSRPQFSSPGQVKQRKIKPIDYDDDYDYEQSEKPKYNDRREDRPKTRVNQDYIYDDDDKKEEAVSKVKDIPLKSNVKIVKRPFLPSRGGSQYLPRGMRPVAGRDLTAPINTTPKPTTTSTTTTTTTTTAPTTRLTTTPAPTTTTTAPTTTTTAPTTTTPAPTTTFTTESQTADLKHDEYDEEYYDEEDIEYEKKESTTPAVTRAPETTTYHERTTQKLTHDEKAKNLATKVLKVYNDNYEAIRDKLESTLSPANYIKPYLATAVPLPEISANEPYKAPIKTNFKPIEPRPEISKPYTATGKPPIPENISIKQNLADSLENDYDVSLNEALSPSVPVNRIPSGFVIPPDRDYTFSRFRSNIQPEPQYAASEISSFQARKRPQVQGVSIRTPSSYYIQPQRVYTIEDGLQRYPRQLFRQIAEFF